MKRIIITMITGYFLVQSLAAQLPYEAEGNKIWGSGALSFHVSTLGANTPIVFNAEKLFHWEKVRLSFGTGVNFNFLHAFEEKAVGPHLTAGFWTGNSIHHFEFKAGGTFLFNLEGEFLFPFPILTTGYRFQKPGGDTFFRFDIGTGGLGVGFGRILR